MTSDAHYMIETDKLINHWLDQVADARRAMGEDPQYHQEIQWMRRIFALIDRAMAYEGIDARVRDRILRAALYGSPDETAAIARIANHHKLAQRLMEKPFEPYAVLKLPHAPEWAAQ